MTRSLSALVMYDGSPPRTSPSGTPQTGTGCSGFYKFTPDRVIAKSRPH